MAILLFLAIWGAKLVVIDRFGSDLPYWDQWNGEAEMTLQPWLEHRELWRPVVVPHSEHRIVPTRLLALGLVLAGGQWDARVQCVVNAALHALIAAGLFLWFSRHLARGWAVASALLLLLVAGAPIPWENVLGGFQSQFYFLIGLSLLAIGNLLSAAAFSPRWWFGAACGFLAVVSMGSGLLCGMPVVAVVALRWWRHPIVNTREIAATAAVGCLIVALGIWLRAPAPHHDPLHARSIGEFLGYAIRSLAWPVSQWPWLAGLIWLPWLGLLARWHKGGRGRPDFAAEFVIAGGGWLWLQAAAVSYGRGAASLLPPSRYGDLLVLGWVFGFAGLALLATRRPRRRHTMMGAAYLLLLGGSVFHATQSVWTGELPSKKADSVAYEANLQMYLLTGDYESFARDPVPFPDADWLREVLHRPFLPPLLPASVRTPLRIEGIATTDPIGERLAHRRSRVMREPGEWRSGPIRPGRGWWKIETAGDVGTEGATLELVSDIDGRVLGSVAPSRFAGESWRAAYVRAPSEPARLVARLDQPGKWLGFSEPVEQSTLSHAAWRLAKHGRWWLLLGFFGGCTIAAYTVSNRPVRAFLMRPPVWFTLLACLAVLWARRPDAFANPQFWAEDGFFYQNAMLSGWATLVQTYAGYLHTLPRLVALLAKAADPAWAPHIFVASAALATLWVAARTQSSRSPFRTHAGFALATVLVPDAFEVLLNLANLQWVLAAGFVLILISADPKRWWQLAHDLTALLLLAFTGPFSVVLAPLFVARAWLRRTRSSWVLAALVSVGGAIQAWSIWANPYPMPGDQFVPGLLLVVPGLRIAGSWFLGHWSFAEIGLVPGTLLGIFTIGAVAALAWRGGEDRRARIALAASFLVLLGSVLFRSKLVLPDLCHPGSGARYFYPLMLLVVWLVLAAAGDSRRWISWGAIAAVGWTLAVNLPRLREPPLVDRHWGEYVPKIRAGERVLIPINPEGWTFELPGSPPPEPDSRVGP